MEPVLPQGMIRPAMHLSSMRIIDAEFHLIMNN
jgi:hypothetical protein